jgi:hypothetical protein
MEKKLFVPITKSDFNDVSTSTRSAPKTECTNHPHDPQRLLRLPQVLELIPVSKSCWWQWVRDGKAPDPSWRSLHLLALWRHYRSDKGGGIMSESTWPLIIPTTLLICATRRQP